MGGIEIERFTNLIKQGNSIITIGREPQYPIKPR